MKKKHLKRLARTRNKNKPAITPPAPENVIECTSIVEVKVVQQQQHPLPQPQPRSSRPARSLSDLIKSEMNEYEKKLAEMNAKFNENAA